jgi:hypothetical protein
MQNVSMSFSETSPHPVSLMVASLPTLEMQKHKESSNHDVQSKRSDDRRVVGHGSDPMSQFHPDRVPLLLHLRGFLCYYGCSVYSPTFCAFGSVTHTITCPGSLVTDTTPIIQTIPQVGGPALANLKDQLKQALDLAERQQAAQAESQQLQTVADAEMLEKKLNEAIEDVRARKAELQKKK